MMKLFSDFSFELKKKKFLNLPDNRCFELDKLIFFLKWRGRLQEKLNKLG